MAEMLAEMDRIDVLVAEMPRNVLASVSTDPDMFSPTELLLAVIALRLDDVMARLWDIVQHLDPLDEEGEP
jgi:hypothetical protein